MDITYLTQWWNQLKRSHYIVKKEQLSEDAFIVCLFMASLFVVYLGYKLLRFLNPAKKLKRVGLTVLDKAFGISGKVEKGLMEIRKEVHKVKTVPLEVTYSSVPKLSDQEIIERLEKIKAVDRKKELEAKQGGNYYFSNKEDNREFVSKLAANFFYTNPMHFDSSPGSQLIENELIRFMLELANAPKGAVGTTTTGGTESILLAMLAYRELGLKKGINDPEILVPDSAHVAFLKAAFLFKIKVNLIKVSEETGAYEVKQFLNAITRNTVAVICSAGTYAHGVIDPISEINKALQNTDIWIHVDSCLGGFLSTGSMLKGDGRLPVVDFRLSRVGSISMDPHKYGESPKGCSVIMFRTDELKKCSLFYYLDWNGGIYATPSIPGSRTAAAYVGAWVSMARLGKEGLVRNYDMIIKTLDSVVAMVEEFPELRVIGDPKICVVSFTARKDSGVSIFDIQETIKKDGWDLSVTQKPYAIHITITKNNMENLLNNFRPSLKKAIEYAKSKPNCGKDSFYNVFYGSLLKLPDNDMIENAIKTLIVEVNRLNFED
jgi:sphinganine-1-phosphate aldolase